MPTDNPKVSGYVPQPIYNSLIEFQKERKISISQAITIVLAEYFGVNHQVDQAFLGGVTLAQIHSLEQTLSDFIESVDQRFQELEAVIKFIKLPSNPPLDKGGLPVQSITSDQNSEPLGEIIDSSENETDVLIPKIIQVLEQDEKYEALAPNELFNKPLEEGVSGTQAEWQNVNTVLLSELQSEPSGKESEKEISDELKVYENEPIPGIQPLSGIQLGKRLNVHHSAVTRYKSGKRKQSLTEWSKSVDPDGVAWEYSEEQKKYIPLSQGKPNIGLQGELLKVDSDDSN